MSEKEVRMDALELADGNDHEHSPARVEPDCEKCARRVGILVGIIERKGGLPFLLHLAGAPGQPRGLLWGEMPRLAALVAYELGRRSLQ